MTSWRNSISLTLPVMMGYLPLGAGVGVPWVDAGLTWYWAPLMSMMVYAGALQYLAVGMLAAGIGWLDLAVASLLVNFRHLFYGLSLYHLLPKGRLGRPYFIFGITDETYSLLSASGHVKDSKAALKIVALNQGYWILGTLIGMVLARGLPPGLQGLDFALTALFTVLAVEQIRAKKDWGAVWLGLISAAVAGFWVSEYFLLAASVMLVLVLLAWPDSSKEAGKEAAEETL